MAKDLLIWLGDSGSDDTLLVGEKNAKLGSLTQLVFPIIPGFVITKKAHKEFLSSNNLRTKYAHLRTSLPDKNFQENFKKEINNSQFPNGLADELLAAYIKLVGHVRHSAISLVSSNSLQKISVTGEANVLLTIKKLWKDALEISPDEEIAILVQDDQKIEKEGVYHTNETDQVFLPLSDSQKQELVSLGQKAKKEFYFPQTFHWVLTKQGLYIVDMREFTPSQSFTTHGVELPQTATKVFVSINSHKADAMSKLHVEGCVFYSSQQAPNNIVDFSKSFSPRPVFCALSPVSTNEFFLGDVKAIENIRNTKDCKNVSIILQGMHTYEDIIEAKKYMVSVGLHRSPTFKVWMTIEFPSQTILLDKFIEEGIDGIFIHAKKLSYALVGQDKNDFVQNPSAIWSYEHIVRTAHKYNIPSIFYEGNAPKTALLEKLVTWGISIIVVDSNELETTRRFIAKFEKQLVSN